MPEATRPLPQPDDVTRPFWEACAQRRLCFQHCRACGHRWLPASVVCPRCWASEGEWVESRGDGTVFSFVVYRRVYHPSFASLVPYAVAVIELAEGPRLISNVVGIGPDQVRIGMPVRVEFADIGGTLLPVFRCREGAA